MSNEFTWIVSSEVLVRECDPSAEDDVVVNEIGGGNRSVKMRVEDDKLLFNGKFVDVGDDEFAYIGMIEAAYESPDGAVLFTDNTVISVRRP